MTKNKQGGKRTGAGRPPKAPTVVYQFNTEKQLRDYLRTLYTAKEINKALTDALINLALIGQLFFVAYNG